MLQRPHFSIGTTSSSSPGAITVMFGKSRRYAVSKQPWCVGPSGPVRPERSSANVTGKFCNATSWKTWSNEPLQERVE